jgi:hypothetical protein
MGSGLRQASRFQLKPTSHASLKRLDEGLRVAVPDLTPHMPFSRKRTVEARTNSRHGLSPPTQLHFTTA